MPSYYRTFNVCLIIILLIGGPWGYAHWRNENLRNTREVRSGILYRSGQLSEEGLKRVIHDYGIRTVVTFRYPAKPGEEAPDAAEELFCRNHQLNYFRLPHKDWSKDPGGGAPVDANIAQFNKIMSNENNYPVLVHCYAGVHRTGAFCAIYRMEFENWTADEAIREMRSIGYEQIDDHEDVRAYLRNYQRQGHVLGQPAPLSGLPADFARPTSK